MLLVRTPQHLYHPGNTVGLFFFSLSKPLEPP